MNLRKLGFLGIAPLVLGTALFAACGGGGGGTGSDEDYVADICKAGAEFQESLFAAFDDIDFDAPEEEQIKAFEEPFRDFAKAIEKANPPADMKDWHNDAVRAINQLVEQIRSGDTEALESDDDPFEDPPAAASARLQAIAEKNKDCIDADFTFD